MSVLGLLILGGMDENGLDGRVRDRLGRRTGIDEGKLGAGGRRDLSSFDRGKGDDGEIELLAAGVGSDAQVTPRSGVWVGRLGDDVERGPGVQEMSELELDGVVTRGGDRSEALAELVVADVVVEEALLADLRLARAEGCELKGGGDFAVAEGECSERGKDGEGGSGEKGGVLEKGHCGVSRRFARRSS
jgi:hypothetical protein